MELKSIRQFVTKYFIYILGTVLAIAVALAIMLLNFFSQNDYVVSPVGTEKQVKVKPFDKYTVLNLANYQASASPIEKIKLLKDSEKHSSYLVSYTSVGKKVSGMLKIPNAPGPDSGFPVIVMIRGYVDPTIYYTGLGTERAGEVFADNGYITFAPDFLGYGESEKEAENVFESRFQTYTTTLDALASVSTIEEADSSRVGIWAHSNGGQITVTVLEASQKTYPASLWAPVTKPFPYSILYYTDEADDRGKFLRRELARFEEDYNADFYALTDYVDRIKAPLQLHQGGSDDAIPQKWSEQFVDLLKENDVSIQYYFYPGADHNLLPSWNTVIARDLEFFDKYL